MKKVVLALFLCGVLGSCARVFSYPIDTLIVTDSTLSARIYWSIGASGVVNVFTREPLYGGGAQTTLSFPFQNGVGTIAASFDGTIISTLSLSYGWQLTDLSPDIDVYANVGGFYSTFPQEVGPARKWVGLPFGAFAVYRLGSVGLLKGSLDLMPHVELLAEGGTARITGFGDIGLGVYIGLSFNVPISR